MTVKIWSASGVRNRKFYLAPGMRNGKICLAPNYTFEKKYLAVKGLKTFGMIMIAGHSTSVVLPMIVGCVPSSLEEIQVDSKKLSLTILNWIPHLNRMQDLNDSIGSQCMDLKMSLAGLL